METVAPAGHSEDSGGVASRRLPAVLKLAVTSRPPRRRQNAGEPGDPGLDLSYGRGESDLGAPRIHGELLKLGFRLSEPTVSRWLRRARRVPDPAQRWLTFLRNHRKAIAAMDFFTVPTLTFGVLYCFFVIGHDRRKDLTVRRGFS